MRRTKEQITEEIMRRSEEYIHRQRKRRKFANALCISFTLILLLSVTVLRLNPYGIPSESEMLDGTGFDILLWFQELLSNNSESRPGAMPSPSGALGGENNSGSEVEPTQGDAWDDENVHLPFVTVSEFMVPTDSSVPGNSPFPTDTWSWSEGEHPFEFETLHIFSDEHSLAIMELLNSARFNDGPPIHESAPTFRDDVGYAISIYTDDGMVEKYTLIGLVLHMESGEVKYMSEMDAEELHRMISDELYD